MERKWKQILEQWKDNLSRKNQLLLIFLVGILLLVVAFPVSKKDSKAEKTIQETSSVRNVQTSLENYEEYLEKELNIEYPGGFKHNKHGGLMRELLEKVAERYV